MLNQCNFIGNLGGDPSLKYTQSGTPVCNFSIAVTERWKDKEGTSQEQTEWVNIVAWRRLAEVCSEFLSKGSKVYISGKYTTRKYQDQSGSDRYTTEVIAKDMQMLSPRQSQGDDNGQYSSGKDFPPEPPSTEKDIPF